MNKEKFCTHNFTFKKPGKGTCAEHSDKIGQILEAADISQEDKKWSYTISFIQKKKSKKSISKESFVKTYAPMHGLPEEMDRDVLVGVYPLQQEQLKLPTVL